MTTDGIGRVGASGTNSLASSMIARLVTELGTTFVTNFAVSMLMAVLGALYDHGGRRLRLRGARRG